ncbi:hypothetical protein ALC53_10187 [Atta colombica]|uniref:Uncharacterized protein n=1 Tax=Atta colombica TaxID=520822 RepID=A0A195B548_9HYME|nr:hypothetical protein ALC53_10187 [Atta colombica]
MRTGVKNSIHVFFVPPIWTHNKYADCKDKPRCARYGHLKYPNPSELSSLADDTFVLQLRRGLSLLPQVPSICAVEIDLCLYGY